MSDKYRPLHSDASTSEVLSSTRAAIVLVFGVALEYSVGRVARRVWVGIRARTLQSLTERAVS